LLPEYGQGSDQQALIDAVTMLPAFERFVFVISVLEGHSLSDTATMLGCTNSQLKQARSRALTQMATLMWHRTSQLPEGAIQPHWYARLESA
jgi:DNA-directed RNA polymerase specialized sigma24 family protein